MHRIGLKTAWLGAMLLMLALTGCAAAGRSKQMTALEMAQYQYSAAIRWGDFEGAWTVVDPEYRKAHPMTDLEFERYKQVQISGYRDLAAQVSPDGTAAREIQIGVINRHNLTERSTRYTERWRYDAVAKTWWITSGLPDLWN
ncbi:MAG TPA: hypothetical protein VNI56_02665 [Xanthomonadaceae bacterium]|nr:hypothetical protein [Xanthomonadaceae bacterium]